MTWFFDSNLAPTFDSTSAGYSLDGGSPVFGVAVTAEASTAAGVGLETIAGTVSTSAAETLAAVGLELLLGTVVTAEVQTQAAVAIELFAGTVVTAEAQTSLAVATEAISGVAVTAEAESQTAIAVELFTGTVVTAESQTLAAQGSATLGLLTTAESQSVTALGNIHVDATAVQKILVSALRPTFGGAVYPSVAPDNAKPPYAVYFRVIGTVNNTLADGAPIENNRYQIDSWSSNYDEVHQLALQARSAMLAIPYPIGVVLLTEADQYENDVKLHRVIQDYSVWSPRSN